MAVASVAFPNSVPGLFDYSVPDHLTKLVVAGTPVLVELRSRTLWGMVVVLKEHSEFAKLKPVLEAKSGMQLGSFQSLVKVYEWIASYYQCELGTVFKPFVRKKILETPVKEVKGYTRSAAAPEDLTAKQLLVWDKIPAPPGEFSRTELIETHRISEHMIAALVDHEALLVSVKTVFREADQLAEDRSSYEVTLNDQQRAASDEMKAAFDHADQPFLLHGVTGSGKTHVYIELAKHAISLGKGVIILVPEISLTPQTISRFKSAIGDSIAVMHSNMSEGERRDNLEELIAGRKRVVVGVRSAILAPVADLGLIVVDEEHDGSYKQADPEPRYHARDVAVMRGRLQRALVVLGSATPSLESFQNAASGKFRLCTLTSRFGIATLPKVEIVDMAAEHKADNWTLLSNHLRARIEETLRAGRQIILLLNRRGFASFLLCKDCGHIYACPRCSVNLTYHLTGHLLRCHQCGHEMTAPMTCVKCHGPHLQFKGTGIQKAEEYIAQLFPGVRMLRMDQDTTSRKGAHVTILEEFGSRRADILLGTQMVSKGLDFPGVALVGVLQADVGLHIPDFRASERTFQLLTQVAGRAGRIDAKGEVVIQTYCPTDPSVTAAQSHDYAGFVAGEIERRRELGYPPFCRLARILVTGEDEAKAKQLMADVKKHLSAAAVRSITILGPAPAMLARIDAVYRFSLLIKSTSPQSLQKLLADIRATFAKRTGKMKVIIDVDPLNMM